jgi:hypothetical protein
MSARALSVPKRLPDSIEKGKRSFFHSAFFHSISCLLVTATVSV